MVSRTPRAETLALGALALLGNAGGSVFGVLANEGGTDHLRNILLGVVCATILISATAANRFIAVRLLQAGVLVSRLPGTTAQASAWTVRSRRVAPFPPSIRR
jgi:hypothetical protein